MGRQESHEVGQRLCLESGKLHRSPKNPEDPEEALEGSTVASADYIRSFDGPVKTLTLTTALIPVFKCVNAKFGELRRTNFASKLYLLLYDTDIDFMVYIPMTNLELRFRTAFLLGKKGTEFGEKQNDYRIEFRIRYHFGL